MSSTPPLSADYPAGPVPLIPATAAAGSFAASPQPGPRRFSVDEYYRMAEVGILTERDRVELIEGEVVMMSPMGSRHAACIARLEAAFHAALTGDVAQVRTQLPVRLDAWNEPEPDVALVVPRADFYANAHPAALDVLIAVEVGDATAAGDRRSKLPLYARFGIREVWLIDVQAQHVEVHSRPADERFEELRTFHRGDRLCSTTLSGLSLDVAAILG